MRITASTTTRQTEHGCTVSSAANHTPGPWELHKQSTLLMVGDCDWSLHTEEAGAFLLFCHHPDAPAKANAHLIAAAPELLAALKEVVAISDRKHDAWDMARAAIAKAEGHS